MARLKISLTVGTADISAIDIAFPNADANDILNAYRVGAETDAQVMDALAATWIETLERAGYAEAESKLIRAAITNVQTNFAEKKGLRNDPIIASVLAAKRARVAALVTKHP